MSGVAQPYARRKAPSDGQLPGFLDQEHQNIQRAISGAQASFDLPAQGRATTDPTVYLANNAIYNVRDYTDFLAATTAAKTYGGSGARIEWTGNINVTDTINVDAHRLDIKGKGRYASSITFTPTSAKPLFKVQNSTPGQVIYQGSFGGFGLIGGGTQQKIAFDLWDQSEFLIEDIAVASSWTGNSGSTATPSIGIRSNGREVLTVRRADIFADRPIHLRVNPNASTLSDDHYHFQDLYFATLVASETGILIDAQCVVSNLLFDGYQAWIGGKYGLDFTAGGAVAASLMAAFHNVRYEQSGDATGFAFRWQPLSCQNLLLSNCYWGGVSLANGGVYVRNTGRVTLDNNLYSGGVGTTALDVDATCDNVFLKNTFFQDLSTANIGTLETAFALPKRNTNSPLPPTCYLISPSTGIKLMKTHAGMPAASFPVGSAAMDGSYGLDTTNNRWVYYANGNRYYVAGTLF